MKGVIKKGNNMNDYNGKDSFSSVELDPTEFYDECPTKGAPERRLASAVLERALNDIIGNDLKERDDAEEWINAEYIEDKPEPMSFQWVCMSLDLDFFGLKDKIFKLRYTRKERSTEKDN